MKRAPLFTVLALAGTALLQALAGAQPAIERHVVAGGGGKSTGGVFVLHGTVAQNAAGPATGPLSGGVFALWGEFWPLMPPPCPADFNSDGFVSGDDFDQYVAAFELGESAADFNGDGFVTGDDFDAFVVAFEAGC